MSRDEGPAQAVDPYGSGSKRLRRNRQGKPGCEVTQRSGPEPEEAEARGSAQQPKGIDRERAVCSAPGGSAREGVWE